MPDKKPKKKNPNLNNIWIQQAKSQQQECIIDHSRTSSHEYLVSPSSETEGISF